MSIKNLLKSVVNIRVKEHYEYSATRARVMSSRLLSDSDYSKFLKMDVNEIIRFLEENEYKKEIDEIGLKSSVDKISLIEGFLNLNLANTINKILGFAPKKSPVREYLRKYDILNIKTIIRGKISKKGKKEILGNLIFAGTLSRNLLSQLAEKNSKDEVIGALKGTIYYNILKENEKKALEELEDALDRFYFAKITEIAKPYKNMRTWIKNEIDIKNILSLFRIKKANIKDFSRFFVQGGNIGLREFAELYKKGDFEIINLLKTRAFWKFTPANTKELEKLEAGFRKYQMLYGYELLKSYAPTFDTILGYIISKEREINNIRIIVRSKLIKNPEDAISVRSKLYVK